MLGLRIGDLCMLKYITTMRVDHQGPNSQTAISGFPSARPVEMPTNPDGLCFDEFPCSV